MACRQIEGARVMAGHVAMPGGVRYFDGSPFTGMARADPRRTAVLVVAGMLIFVGSADVQRMERRFGPFVFSPLLIRSSNGDEGNRAVCIVRMRFLDDPVKPS
jgi:hypothetical protein